ncbi:carbohydrate kinase family protein [Deinococcus yavapaiensis]|uniref:Fructokinase n=1 Tax=Deinococcus yavapaiensis KR-236 TaxID=694435 RepID=A0A318S815_9DEIO|nr:carbohydrate kinase [Deinococcus yavapaiensis]PYE54592.1 fructokinase [Deinococcus yavapaiensis KR-236]
MTVLVFGGAVMDFVRRGDAWDVRQGGSAWNVSRVLAALGSPCEFVGALGTDEFGEEFVRAGEASGVGLRFAVRVDAPTPLSVVHDSEASRYVFYARGCADSLFESVPEEAWPGATAAYFGGVTLVRQPRFLRAAEQARERGSRIVYDPNFRPAHADEYRAAFPRYLKLATLLKVSDGDLRGVLPHASLDEALAFVRNANPSVTVLLTLGADGARLIGPDFDVSHEGFAVKIVDTVGAGDASIAALLHAHLTAPPDPSAHLSFSLAAAAAACRRPGAYAPPLSEVLEVMT